MAMIKDVHFDAVFTDVKSTMLNALGVSGGGDYYFGYVNSSGHGVVYSSGDRGATWSLDADYGPADYVAVTAAKDGDIVVTVASSVLVQTAVYKSGSQRVVAPYANQGAVTFWPMTFYLGEPVTGFGTMGDASTGDFGAPNSATIFPVFAVLNYGPNDGEYITVSDTTFDVFFGGKQPVTIGDIHAELQNPADPHSPLVMKYSSVPLVSWPGMVSSTYSGYTSFHDYSGAGTGGGVFLFDFSLANSRGTFYDGFVNNDIYIADRGLNGPHRTAFSCTVDGTQVAFFVDRYGLYGSTVNDGVNQSLDSSGTFSPFDKAKVYGSTSDTWGSLCWGEANQSGALVVFTQTANTSETTHTIWRISDPTPLVRTHAKNTQLYSKLTSVQTTFGAVADPFDTTTNSNALGPARVTGTPPKYGIALLVQACTSPSVLANPNGSPGCSPILRELMNQSGVPYSVTREMANDGDPAGHQGGNALDLAGPSTSTVLTGASVTDAASQEMGEITSFLTAVPSLFATVIHYDPVTPGNSLFIWDGQIVTAAHFGGVTAQIVKDSISNIHISSSATRLLKGFQDPTVQAALGVGPGVTDPSTGAQTSQVVPDLFGTDRYVYVNDDGYIGNTTEGLAAKKEPAQIINFW